MVELETSRYSANSVWLMPKISRHFFMDPPGSLERAISPAIMVSSFSAIAKYRALPFKSVSSTVLPGLNYCRNRSTLLLRGFRATRLEVRVALGQGIEVIVVIRCQFLVQLVLVPPKPYLVVARLQAHLPRLHLLEHVAQRGCLQVVLQANEFVEVVQGLRRRNNQGLTRRAHVLDAVHLVHRRVENRAQVNRASIQDRLPARWQPAEPVIVTTLLLGTTRVPGVRALVKPPLPRKVSAIEEAARDSRPQRAKRAHVHACPLRVHHLVVCFRALGPALDLQQGGRGMARAENPVHGSI